MTAERGAFHTNFKRLTLFARGPRRARLGPTTEFYSRIMVEISRAACVLYGTGFDFHAH